MDIEDVNVMRAKLLQRRLERYGHGLDVVARVLNLLRDVGVSTLVIDSVL